MFSAGKRTAVFLSFLTAAFFCRRILFKRKALGRVGFDFAGGLTLRVEAGVAADAAAHAAHDFHEVALVAFAGFGPAFQVENAHLVEPVDGRGLHGIIAAAPCRGD